MDPVVGLNSPSDSSSSFLQSSSPLSTLSRTPSLQLSSPTIRPLNSSPTPPLPPSKRYPSPSSSTPSGSQSPSVKLGHPTTATLVDGDGQSIRVDDCVDECGPPPRKRRRVASPPKPRTTEHLDLQRTIDDDDYDATKDALLDRLLAAVRRRKRIVVVAGAGISVSAGIPDFRSSNGLFATLGNEHNKQVNGSARGSARGSGKGSGKSLFDSSVYKQGPLTDSFHAMVRRLAHMSRAARPTPFHQMLASLAEEGRLMRLYTQNVDGIDTAIGPLATTVPLNFKGPWPATIQLHGGLETMVCTLCRKVQPLEADLFRGAEAPLCPLCKDTDEVRVRYGNKRSHGIGRLRPRILLYNEDSPDAEAIGNVSQADLKRGPDCVLVVGTSLKIPGVRRLVRELCLKTRSRRDGFTAWINVDGEPVGGDFRDCWDMVVRGRCDDIAQLVGLPHWDDKDGSDERSVISDAEQHRLCEQRIRRDRVEVHLLPSPTLPSSGGNDDDDNNDDKSSNNNIMDQSNKSLRLGHDPYGVQRRAGILTPGASPKLGAQRFGKQVGRLKQSRLAFGTDGAAAVAAPQDTGADSDVSVQRAARARGRRPLPTKKPPSQRRAALKNTVQQTFKLAKNPAAIGAGWRGGKKKGVSNDNGGEQS